MRTTVEQLLARLLGYRVDARGLRRRPADRGHAHPRWTLEQYRRLGLTEAQSGCLPGTPGHRPVNAWSYVAGHRDEIQRQIRENEEA